MRKPSTWQAVNWLLVRPAKPFKSAWITWALMRMTTTENRNMVIYVLVRSSITTSRLCRRWLIKIIIETDVSRMARLALIKETRVKTIVAAIVVQSEQVERLTIQSRRMMCSDVESTKKIEKSANGTSCQSSFKLFVKSNGEQRSHMKLLSFCPLLIRSTKDTFTMELWIIPLSGTRDAPVPSFSISISRFQLQLQLALE